MALFQEHAMTHHRKTDFPVDQIRRFIEPGPIVLVSSAHKGERNIMTLGWHMVMGFSPSLVGCYIWDKNHSFDLIRKSKECVINVPTVEMAKTVVGIGNCSGEEIDKFAIFGLTPVAGKKVSAPMIKECSVNLECKLVDSSLIKKHSLFIFEVVKAHALTWPEMPRTIHYRGDGQFMIAGEKLNLRRYFKPEMLDD
jgi:flavin reductase (DIM6/NTAB) family NADH-FMN oxidoreductase RutF